MDELALISLHNSVRHSFRRRPAGLANLVHSAKPHRLPYRRDYLSVTVTHTDRWLITSGLVSVSSDDHCKLRRARNGIAASSGSRLLSMRKGRRAGAHNTIHDSTSGRVVYQQSVYA